jgi:hypothetical protein
MIYPFLRSLRLLISQVSHSGPPIPCPSYPLSFSPHPAPKLPSLHFLIILCINLPTILHFTCPPLPSCIFPFPAPSPTIFAFWDYYGFPLLLVPLPTFPHHIGLLSNLPDPLHDSSHSLSPACSPTQGESIFE